MKDYKKPLFIMTDSVSEGVYMASGGAECWDVRANSVQDWNGSHHVFEVHAVHSTAVTHISSNLKVVFKFSVPLTDAYSEFPCTFSGDTVTVNRPLHANAYYSGDNVTYKVWVKGMDEATTKAITCSGCTPTCTHTVNVQGGYD